MDASEVDRIDGLLRQGLDFYGLGEVERALSAWREVLDLQPENRAALDYLETAERGDAEGLERVAARVDATVSALEEARELIGAGALDEALELLRAADDRDLRVDATIELVRSHLYRRYRKRVGSLTAVPRLCSEAEPITRFNLPPDAGFLLSHVDGATALCDLVALSGMDGFEALRLYQGLLDAGILCHER